MSTFCDSLFNASCLDQNTISTPIQFVPDSIMGSQIQLEIHLAVDF